MYEYRPLDLIDFSGGMVDQYVGAAPNRGQFVTNLIILENKTARSRFGNILDNSVAAEAQIPVGTQRINTLVNYNNDDALFAHSGKRLYYRNPAAYSTVTSTVSTDLFANADAQTHLGHTQWNKHLIITPESFDKPIKIYKDSGGIVRARTAGLPTMATTPVLTPAVPPLITPNFTGGDALFEMAHGLIAGQAVHFIFDDPVNPIPLATPLQYYVTYYAAPFGANQFFLCDNAADAIAFTNFIVLTNRPANTIFYKLATVAAPASQIGALLYGFMYSYEYTVGSQTFIDFGPVTLAQKLNVFSPDVYSVSISAIPTLVNGAGDHYDTAVIKKQIFRTINGGQTLYKVAEVTNATTVYVDTLSDDLLQDNETIYTTGGVPENDPPPLAKYCHTVNNKTYYAHIKVGSEVFPSVIRQSQELDPDSVPASYFDELEDEITGISSIQDIPIVGCRKHIYRVEGYFDLLGRGGISHRRISDHAGLLSHESFVQAEGALFWFGEDGIYHSEGFKCTKVTNHLNDTYKKFKLTLADKLRKIKGVFDPATRTISWSISTTSKVSGSEECDAIWNLDLKWGISEEMTSHVWNGTSFFPTTLVVFNKILTRADKTGYVLKFDSATASDPRIVAGTDPAGWFHNTIIYNFRSITTDFGSGFQRKTANKLLLNVLGNTTQSIQMKAINDEGRLNRDFTPIRWRKGFVWGDEDFVWGDPSFVWYYGGVISVDRRFPAKGLRFNYLQIDLTNAFINIANSDLLGDALVDNTLNTITLPFPTKWPRDSVDYVIYLEQDNYTKGYVVTGRTDQTLVVTDTLNTLSTSSQKWQLKGYKKDEIFNMVSMSISWAKTSRSFDTYNQGDSGGLA